MGATVGARVELTVCAVGGEVGVVDVPTCAWIWACTLASIAARLASMADLTVLPISWLRATSPCWVGVVLAAAAPDGAVVVTGVVGVLVGCEEEAMILP